MRDLMKINQLTTEQEDALRQHHAEWYAYGTSTERSDRPTTEAAITPAREDFVSTRPERV